MRQVDAASSSRDVLRVVREYLATWRADEIARLPKECRPGRPTDVDDVSYVAFQLKRHGRADNLALEAMDAFFAVASRRLCDFTYLRSETTAPRPT
jgi:hypothetical protein